MAQGTHLHEFTLNGRKFYYRKAEDSHGSIGVTCMVDGVCMKPFELYHEVSRTIGREAAPFVADALRLYSIQDQIQRGYLLADGVTPAKPKDR